MRVADKRTSGEYQSGSTAGTPQQSPLMSDFECVDRSGDFHYDCDQTWQAPFVSATVSHPTAGDHGRLRQDNPRYLSPRRRGCSDSDRSSGLRPVSDNSLIQNRSSAQTLNAHIISRHICADVRTSLAHTEKKEFGPVQIVVVGGAPSSCCGPD